MRKLMLLFSLSLVVMLYGVSGAVETKLVVRAKSKDAKFVGTKMGGAKVVIKESDTGRVLAEGLTAGGTGDTGKIMMQPKTRFGEIAGGAASFETVIDIDEPTLITVDVEAPYMYKDNLIKSSTQMWMIPGKDIAGDGLIIEVPGFSVDAHAPASVALSGGKASVPIQANIVMI